MNDQTTVYKIVTKNPGITNEIANKHTENKDLTWYDKKRGNLAMRYSTNHPSIFEIDQEGIVKTAPIVFEEGFLNVDTKRKANLIEFLSKHPDNTSNNGSLFEKVDHAAESKAEEKLLNLEADAILAERELTPGEKRAITRKRLPAQVDAMTDDSISVSIKKFSRANPSKFLSMIESPDIAINDIIQTALAKGLIEFKRGNSEVWWAMEDREESIICKIPTGKDHNAELTRHLMSDAGIGAYKEIEIALKD